MVVMDRFENLDSPYQDEMAGPLGMPMLPPNADRFDIGVRIIDAVGGDLSLDSGILDIDDLLN